MCDDYKIDIIPHLYQPNDKIKEKDSDKMESDIIKLFIDIRNCYITKQFLLLKEKLQCLLNILLHNTIDVQGNSDFIAISPLFLQIIDDKIDEEIIILSVRCAKALLCQPNPVCLVFLNIDSIITFQNAFFLYFCHHAIDCINNIAVQTPNEFIELFNTKEFFQNTISIINDLNTECKISISRLVFNVSKLEVSSELQNYLFACTYTLLNEPPCSKLCLQAIRFLLNQKTFPIDKFIELNVLQLLVEFIQSPMHDHCVISLQCLEVLYSRYSLDITHGLDSIIQYSLDDVMSEKKYWSLCVLSEMILQDPFVFNRMKMMNFTSLLVNQFNKMNSKLKYHSVKIISLYFDCCSDDELLNDITCGMITIQPFIDITYNEHDELSSSCLSFLYKACKICSENGLRDYVEEINNFLEDPPVYLLDEPIFNSILELFNR